MISPFTKTECKTNCLGIFPPTDNTQSSIRSMIKTRIRFFIPLIELELELWFGNVFILHMNE